MTSWCPSPTLTPHPPKKKSPIQSVQVTLPSGAVPACAGRGSDGRTRKHRQTTALSTRPQLGKQRRPPAPVATTLTRDSPISRCSLPSRPRPRPRPHDKEKALGEQGLPASTDGGGGCRGEEPPPLARAHTPGPRNGRKRRGAGGLGRGGRVRERG